MNEQSKSLKDVVRGMTVFIIFMFALGFVLATVAGMLYWRNTASSERLFQLFVIITVLGFSFPMFAISMRLMVKMYFMTYRGMENSEKMIDGFQRAQDKLDPVADKLKLVIEKAVPIANNVDEIVTRAKGMSEDIEKIAHKIRTAADALNGHLDVKNISDKLDKVADSLTTIASVFKPLNGKKAVDGEEVEIPLSLVPTFDPLKAGGRRRGS